jgi:trimeric autotransporter adhesin
MKLFPVRSLWVEAAPSVLNIRIHETSRRLVVLAALALVATLTACGGSGSKAGASGSSVISTFAGSTNSGFGGDGGPATQAQLNQPVSATFDSSGNMFLADTGNNRIRKVTSSGAISTVAGNGNIGFTGDGGAATSAALNGPRGVAVDGAGNIYIADSLNMRIRKVSTSGVISTIAGTGVAGFAGDGGAALNAQFSSPQGIAVDGSGNIYIADRGNARVRRIDSSGVITTIAGTGVPGSGGDNGPATSAQLNIPTGLALDGSGNLFIADQLNHKIRKMALSGGNLSTIAGNGTGGFLGDGSAAATAELSNPQGVAVDASGNIYIADTGNSRIRKVAGTNISTVAGSSTAGSTGDGGPAKDAQLFTPNGVAVNSNKLYVIDTGNNRVRVVAF